MTTPSNPHDRFFKLAWSRPEVAQGFLARYLPAEVVAVLDLSTLELSKDSFIDETLKPQYSDLLYRLQTQDGQPVYIYVLLEHKSYPDEWVGFQLLRYMVRIWERELQQKTKRLLPPIVPLVLYHGDRTWKAATQFSALVAAPEALAPFTPEFGYQLCDLNRDQLQDLQGQATLQVALQLLKYIFSDELPERLPGIWGLFRTLLTQRRDALAYLETVLRYLAQASDRLDETTLQQALTQALTDDEGDNLMPTLAETWHEQGMQQGRVESLRGTLRHLLSKRFGPLPEAIVQQIETAEQPALDAWLDQVLDAPSLEAMFFKQ